MVHACAGEWSTARSFENFLKTAYSLHVVTYKKEEWGVPVCEMGNPAELNCATSKGFKSYGIDSHVLAINHLLGMGDVVLIGCLGYTPSGEVYNCASEQVAMETAVQLGAHKLIFLYGGHELYDRNTGGVVHSLPFSVGRAFLDLYRADQLELSAKADELCLKQSHEVRPLLRAIFCCANDDGMVLSSTH